MATSLTHLFSKDRTFRPKKKWDEGSLRHGLHKQAKATLQSGLDLRQCVKLPPNETLEDWIAVHVVDFFNRVNLIYGTVSEFCTAETCPVMSGGPKYEYHWASGSKNKKPRAVSAPEESWEELIRETAKLELVKYFREGFYCCDCHRLDLYMELLMAWIETLVNNPDVFPPDDSIPFPKTFLPTCKKVLTRLFRVFVHVYIHHFEKLVTKGAVHCQTIHYFDDWESSVYLAILRRLLFSKAYAYVTFTTTRLVNEAHVNQCYKHFYFFVTEFNLVDKKELEPLKEMTSRLCN